jgi:hypothetical protein
MAYFGAWARLGLCKVPLRVKGGVSPTSLGSATDIGTAWQELSQGAEQRGGARPRDLSHPSAQVVSPWPLMLWKDCSDGAVCRTFLDLAGAHCWSACHRA